MEAELVHKINMYINFGHSPYIALLISLALYSHYPITPINVIKELIMFQEASPCMLLQGIECSP